MKTEVRIITPAIAKEMLKRNSKNRKCAEKHVDFLSREMSTGNWMFDGQPIRFSMSGTLLDGQHRLSAVVLSGTSQEFLVITGIDSEAFKVMDTGKGRSASDVFTINGIQNSSVAAAATRLIMVINEGFSGVATSAKLSNTVALENYNNYNGLAEIISTTGPFYLGFDKILPKSTIAGFRYLMAQKNCEVSDEFWSKVCHGLALEDKCPANALRKKLILDKISVSSLQRMDKMAMIIKAWNAYRKGQKLTYLKWVKTNEKFPELI